MKHCVRKINNYFISLLNNFFKKSPYAALNYFVLCKRFFCSNNSCNVLLVIHVLACQLHHFGCQTSISRAIISLLLTRTNLRHLGTSTWNNDKETSFANQLIPDIMAMVLNFIWWWGSMVWSFRAYRVIFLSPLLPDSLWYYQLVPCMSQINSSWWIIFERKTI